jgi:hypothetical protein
MRTLSPFPVSDLRDSVPAEALPTTWRTEAVSLEEEAERSVEELEARDHLRPTTAGALAGALGAAVALATVRELEPALIAGGLERLQLLTSLDAPVVFGTAFALVALAGAGVGATFAALTHNLRRYFPLLLWSLVFFTSLVTLGQVVAHEYAGLAVLPVRTLFAGAAAFAVVWSLSLPIRRARSVRRLCAQAV